jgi:hypothetical protein
MGNNNNTDEIFPLSPVTLNVGGNVGIRWRRWHVRVLLRVVVVVVVVVVRTLLTVWVCWLTLCYVSTNRRRQTIVCVMLAKYCSMLAMKKRCKAK